MIGQVFHKIKLLCVKGMKAAVVDMVTAGVCVVTIFGKLIFRKLEDLYTLFTSAFAVEMAKNNIGW